jgi:pyruvate/2-oxoglutarate/acetoin dehydrogenase E1 component
MHIPGLRVVCPSTPMQAKGLLTAAIRCDDPVIFLEHSRLYRSFREAVPLEEYVLPLDKCRRVQEGTDLTLLAWGNMLHVSLEAAKMTDACIEIIDLCCLAPLDVEPILESVRKTGRCVVVHEARRTCGPGAELVALINEFALEWLQAPVMRVTGFDVAFPENQTEDLYLPGPRRVKAAIDAVMAYES